MASIVLLSGRKPPLQLLPQSQTFSSSPIYPWYILSCFPSATGQSKWVHQQVSLCRGPVSNTWNSRSHPSHSATISTGFHSQNLWGLLFAALESWDAGPGVGLGPFDPQRGPLQLTHSFWFLTTTCGCGTVHSESPPLLPVSLRLLYILSYRASVQLNFRWSSIMVVL